MRFLRASSVEAIFYCQRLQSFELYRCEGECLVISEEGMSEVESSDEVESGPMLFM
jgi:hypothetical protein